MTAIALLLTCCALIGGAFGGLVHPGPGVERVTNGAWLVSTGLVTALERVLVAVVVTARLRRHRVEPDPVSIAIWRVEARAAGLL